MEFGLPDVQEELDRKAIETLEMILSDETSGRCSTAEAKYGLGILMSAVNGLVRNEFAELIAEAESEFGDSGNVITQVLINEENNGLVVIENNLESNSVTLRRAKECASATSTFDGSITPYSDAKRLAQKILNTMHGKGFK